MDTSHLTQILSPSGSIVPSLTLTLICYESFAIRVSTGRTVSRVWGSSHVAAINHDQHLTDLHL